MQTDSAIKASNNTVGVVNQLIRCELLVCYTLLGDRFLSLGATTKKAHLGGTISLLNPGVARRFSYPPILVVKIP